MSHFIILTSPIGFSTEPHNSICTYRIRADRIDWIAEKGAYTPQQHTVVCVNGVELQVEEPELVILTYIKDPAAPLVGEEQYTRRPRPEAYREKYGEIEGKERYRQDMHYTR